MHLYALRGYPGEQLAGDFNSKLVPGRCPGKPRSWEWVGKEQRLQADRCGFDSGCGAHSLNGQVMSTLVTSLPVPAELHLFYSILLFWAFDKITQSSKEPSIIAGSFGLLRTMTMWPGLGSCGSHNNKNQSSDTSWVSPNSTQFWHYLPRDCVPWTEDAVQKPRLLFVLLTSWLQTEGSNDPLSKSVGHKPRL